MSLMRKPVAIPFSISLALHLAVIALLVFNFSFSSPTPPPPPLKIIEAKLVSMEQLPALRANPKPETQAEPKPVAEPPIVEKNKPEPIKPEPVKPEPPKPEPPKPDVEKQKQVEKQKELEKQIQVEKEKAELQQKKIAEQKKKQEDERKRKEAEEAQRKKQQEETQRKTQEDAERKKREQQEKNELAKAMAAEDNAMAAERDQEAVASYAGMIQRDIQNSWSRPPSARIGMHVVLLIQLIPSGDVINVSVLKSSGNDAFDQSAVSAVRRVGKFAYLKELSDKSLQAFERNFRRLQLDFSPEDLRQ